MVSGAGTEEEEAGEAGERRNATLGNGAQCVGNPDRAKEACVSREGVSVAVRVSGWAGTERGSVEGAARARRESWQMKRTGLV